MVGVLQPSDPQLMGPYRLVGRLGSGGMGRVFLGVSAAGRPVAVKIIHAELAADPEFRARFGVEVAAARKVSGLFTALVVDADVDAPVPWLATAYVAGLSLAEAVKDRGPLSAASLLALAAGLAKSLSAIHAVGVVHGDLKPSNVLLALDGPRVIDFGISQAAGATPLTRGGLVVGTPSFMSPEQATGKGAVGPLSDVFSLGAVLAFAATGRKPFGTGEPAAVLERVVRDAPNLDDAPPEIRPLIELCLAKDPALRPNAPELLAEVSAVQAAIESLSGSGADTFTEGIPAYPGDDGEPPRPGPRRPRRRWRPLVTASAITGLLAAAAGVGYGLTMTRPQPGSAAVSQAEERMDASSGKPARPAAAVARRPAQVPSITRTFTYQQGEMVYFVIVYSDPGQDAAGFGFVGVEGSEWPEQSYSFSNPASGIVEAGSVAFPLNQGCGIGLEYTSTVKAWIYDTAGTHSRPVIIHLACTI